MWKKIWKEKSREKTVSMVIEKMALKQENKLKYRKKGSSMSYIHNKGEGGTSKTFCKFFLAQYQREIVMYDL